ncbi:hypothetical protein GmHk_20G057541 [Glycine max]|nr:hypothetical protein GmHk_20G057541 [Glycine max]
MGCSDHPEIPHAHPHQLAPVSAGMSAPVSSTSAGAIGSSENKSSSTSGAGTTGSLCATVTVAQFLGFPLRGTILEFAST